MAGEVLEARVCLDGNVTAVLSDGVLQINGDRHDNDLTVRLATDADGQTQVRFSAQRTTVNGLAGSRVRLDGEVRTVRAAMGRGDDTISVIGEAGVAEATRTRLDGDLIISTGKHRDRIAVRGLDVGGVLAIDAGKRKDRIVVEAVRVDGTASVRGGRGRDRIGVREMSADPLQLSGGRGKDRFYVGPEVDFGTGGRVEGGRRDDKVFFASGTAPLPSPTDAVPVGVSVDSALRVAVTDRRSVSQLREVGAVANLQPFLPSDGTDSDGTDSGGDEPGGNSDPTFADGFPDLDANEFEPVAVDGGTTTPVRVVTEGSGVTAQPGDTVAADVQAFRVTAAADGTRTIGPAVLDTFGPANGGGSGSTGTGVPIEVASGARGAAFDSAIRAAGEGGLVQVLLSGDDADDFEPGEGTDGGELLVNLVVRDVN